MNLHNFDSLKNKLWAKTRKILLNISSWLLSYQLTKYRLQCPSVVNRRALLSHSKFLFSGQIWLRINPLFSFRTLFDSITFCLWKETLRWRSIRINHTREGLRLSFDWLYTFDWDFSPLPKQRQQVVLMIAIVNCIPFVVIFESKHGTTD